MEPKQSLLLCLVYSLFLMLGAVMFMFLEYEVEEGREIRELREWARLKELALQEESPEDELLALAMWLPKNCTDVSELTLDSLTGPGSQVDAVKEVENMCPHLHVEDINVNYVYPWTFIDALYFSMTVATTIGYGHISPSLPAGRIMCMIYALMGIPLTGMLLAWTSEFFGELLFKLFKSKLDKEKQHSRKVIAAATFIYIAVGFVIFIFLPAVIFMIIEEWTYLEGVYYCFITLTTIGFGDFVSGKNVEGAYIYVYQVCVILWIMVGLGYWVMVANFITKALKSKKLQASVMRSAEEMKKIMQQMGIKNHDPTFLRQHSKATLNFMLQLSNIIAVQGGIDNGPLSMDPESPNSPSPGTSTTSSGQFSPLSSPMGIPGISALFGPAMNRSNPLGQLIGPLGLNKYFFNPRRFSKDGDEELQQEMVMKLQALQAALAEGLASNFGSHLQRQQEQQQPDDTMANSGSAGDETPFLSEHIRGSLSQSQVTLQLEDATTTNPRTAGEESPTFSKHVPGSLSQSLVTLHLEEQQPDNTSTNYGSTGNATQNFLLQVPKAKSQPRQFHVKLHVDEPV